MSVDISHALNDAAAATEFFRTVVEPLSDSFSRAAVDEYAGLLKQVPGCDYWRFQRVRQPRPCIVDSDDVVVLSRVTLGADVAVTSVILDAAKRRFPQAQVWFCGPRKNFELFENDHRIAHIEFDYPRRGSILERIRAAQSIRLPNEALVVDPDSRVTQLGLVPICLERNYFFFESRSYGEETLDPLPVLAARWCRETLGVPDAQAYIAPRLTLDGADTAISLGVGGNATKRLDAAFERKIVEEAISRGSVLIDRGAGGEEAERVSRACDGLPVRFAEGSFAQFAGAIARSRSYVGYDSAGQHVAAACGIPLTVYFTGAINDRFRARWRPHGRGTIDVT